MTFDKTAYMRTYNSLPSTKRRLVHWNRDRDLRRFYGLTFEEFVAIAADTDDQCPICEVNPATHVDHDHSTGIIRGILCNACNRLIGRLDDKKGMLERIVKYYGREKSHQQKLDSQSSESNPSRILHPDEQGYVYSTTKGVSAAL